MSYALKPSFLVSIFKNPLDINVSSTAVAGGSENICVIGLNDSSSSTVRAQNFATLNGPRCAVYSNSTSTSGMNSSNSAQIKSVLTCTSGGYSGSSVNYDPMPQTDCPKRTDPLAERTPPSVGGCDQNQLVKTNFVGTLLPGVYCGGLTIDGASRVDFADGVYVMKDGHLTISGTSVITQGLKGEQIPTAARIFAVADVWDAVTSNRPYRPAWSREQALDYIREQSGKHFDPQVVELFFKVIQQPD